MEIHTEVHAEIYTEIHTGNTQKSIFSVTQTSLGAGGVTEPHRVQGVSRSHTALVPTLVTFAYWCQCLLVTDIWSTLSLTPIPMLFSLYSASSSTT